MGLSNEYIINTLQYTVSNKSSSDNYITRLQKLSSLLNEPIYSILKNPNINKIKEAYPNSVSTQKNMATVILSAFKNIPELALKKQKALMSWKDIHTTLRKEEEAQVSQKTLLSRDEIMLKYNSFKEVNTLESSQDFLILSMALHSPRNMTKIALTPTTGKLTAVAQLADDISASLKKFPRSHIIVKENKEPFTSNSFTVYASKKLSIIFGKHVGINSLPRN